MRIKNVKEKFRVKHSAKDVIYTVESFIERNVDEISSSLEACILSKCDRNISLIYSGNVKNNLN